MKQKLFLVLLFPLICAWTCGIRAETSIGVVGGLASYSFAGDTPPNGAYRSLKGGTFGAVCEIGITEYVTLSIQPSWTRKGTKIAYKVSGQEERVDSVEVKLDYFSVPVLAKVFTNSKRFYVSSGIEYAYLLDAKYITVDTEQDANEELEKHDFSVIFGVGGQFPVGRFDVFIEGRYAQSILNVSTEEAGSSDKLEPRLKNKGFVLCAGILFGL